MTIDELRKLKIGDMIEYNFYFYELHQIKNELRGKVFVFHCDKHMIIISTNLGYCEVFFHDTRASSSTIVENKNGFTMFRLIPANEAIKIKYNIGMIRENDLTQLIPKKEIELENLKKELDELKRKNMLARIVPGNVYRFNSEEYPQETFTCYVRNIDKDNDRVFVTIIKSSSTAPRVLGTFHKFYRSMIKDIEFLPELTEAYKNFKTLLETA